MRQKIQKRCAEVSVSRKMFAQLSKYAMVCAVLAIAYQVLCGVFCEEIII